MECGKPKLIYYLFLLHAFGFVVICWLVAALSWYTLHRSKLGSNDFSPEGQGRGLLERAWNVLINEWIKIGPMDFPFCVIMYSQVLSFSFSCVIFTFFHFSYGALKNVIMVESFTLFIICSELSQLVRIAANPWVWLAYHSLVASPAFCNTASGRNQDLGQTFSIH